MQGGLRVKLLREILLVALSLIIISFAVFFLSSLSSGNISYYVLGDNAREEDVLKLSSSLESLEIKNLYCGGDGAGVTRGLAQAGASGFLIADKFF